MIMPGRVYIQAAFRRTQLLCNADVLLISIPEVGADADLVSFLDYRWPQLLPPGKQMATMLKRGIPAPLLGVTMLYAGNMMTQQIHGAHLVSAKPPWSSFRPSRSSAEPSESRSRRFVSIFFWFSNHAQFELGSPARRTHASRNALQSEGMTIAVQTATCTATPPSFQPWRT